MIRKDFRIAELISRHLSGTLSPEEETELKEWKEYAPEHERLFAEICNTENITAYCDAAHLFDKSEAWGQLNKKLRALERRSFFFQLSRYAALLIVPVMIISSLLYFRSSHDEVETVTVSHVQGMAIRPGEKKATLTLGSGETIDLKAIPEKTLEEEDGTAIVVDADALNYQVAQANAIREKEIYNKIDVPLGGEYALTLSDGTKVFMNAMSSLKFPVRFVNEQRIVELQGEAYFVIAKNDRPFIVKAKGVDVEVLGTVFNISAYEGDHQYTTLVEGSVKVSTVSGANRILKPSEQAYMEYDSDELNVRVVDVAEYTSWVNGKISFKDQRLEDIMKNLSRWYEIDVEYGDAEVKNLRFGCYVNRYKEITPFLELLEKTGKVSITVDANKIIFNHHK